MLRVLFQGPLFVEFAASLCHSATVPVALHLDQCLEEKDVDVALSLPFDSIMVDGSRGDPEENIAFVSKVVETAKKKGIPIEAEPGRIQGGESGIPAAEMESLYTNPEEGAEFVDKTWCPFPGSFIWRCSRIGWQKLAGKFKYHWSFTVCIPQLTGSYKKLSSWEFERLI